MKRYRCTKCGFEFDESRAIRGDDGQLHCPLCRATLEYLMETEPLAAEPSEAEPEVSEPEEIKEATSPPLNESSPSRTDTKNRYLAEIQQIAATGESIIEAMGIEKPQPDWDDILILGAQLDPAPLERDETVETTTIIGKNADKPLVLESPIYISHMSFGALSREAKIALAQGSALAKTAICSGEGGILREELDSAYKYISEYVPNRYSVTPENLKKVDAIEIKIGQGTKPGLGGHLPGDKVTDEIAAIRGKKAGEDIHSPSKFKDIQTRDDLKRLVGTLRAESEGRPIGVKLAAGRIEQDLVFCTYAEPDFITIDGRGGATGASPKFVRDATSVPTIHALYRARKFLDSIHSDISLVITGGLRISSDFAKAIALGADAVAIATAALIAAGCQQYRLCDSGSCPGGIATQDPELRARLDIDVATKQVANFLNVSLAELQSFARLTGHKHIHDLNIDDLCTINREISDFTDIAHV